MERLGKYHIARRLSQGRSTDILLGHSEDAGGFHRECAIKAMSPRFARVGSSVRAFIDETRTTAMLTHPNIAMAFDCAEDRGRYYMVLEYVPGWSLRSVFATLALRRKLVSLDIAMSLVRDIAAGLHHAHMLGVVHRDVTPSNVLLGKDGYAKLIDWGSALAVEDGSSSGNARRPTATRYSAPEVIWNDPTDARADVYSLGVILFELSTGRQLFKNGNPLDAIAKAEIPKPSTVRRGYPASLESVVKRALSQHPDDRFRTAGDLQLALEMLATEHKFPLSSFRVGAFLTGLFDELEARTPPTSVLRNANAGKTRIRVTRSRQRAV